MLPTTFDQFARSEANDASDCLHRFCGVSMQILDPTGVTHRPPGVEGGPLGNLAKRANTLDEGIVGVLLVATFRQSHLHLECSESDT